MTILTPTSTPEQIREVLSKLSKRRLNIIGDALGIKKGRALTTLQQIMQHPVPSIIEHYNAHIAIRSHRLDKSKKIATAAIKQLIQRFPDLANKIKTIIK